MIRAGKVSAKNCEKWDIVHNPEAVLGLFEGDEAGAMISADDIAVKCDPMAVPKALRDIAERAKMCDNDIDDDIEKIPDTDFEKLCIDQRIDLIKCIDDFPAQGSDDEILIKLLKTTPAGHRYRLMSRLQSEKIYQNRLIEAVDGEEFLELINTISQWIGQPTQADWEEAVISNRFVFFNGDDAFNASFNDQGGMDFKTRENFHYSFQWWDQQLSVKPHEFVAVTFTNEFIIAGQRFNAGDQVTMSGLAMWSLFNEMFNKRIRAGGAVALDIPLLFVGIGEINALKNAVAVSRAIRALRYAKAGADIIIATGGLVMASGLEDELTLTLEGRETLKYWTWFNLIYAGGTLTPHAINSAKGLYSSGKNLLTRPNLSASARAAVEKWMETLKDIFKKQGKNIDDAINAVIDFTVLDIPNAMKHVKFRDLAVPRSRGIGGCHDAIEFAKVRQVSAVSNPNYQVAIGKTLDQVEEIVILKDVPHPSVPGVRQIEYKIPAIDGTKNPMVTTGALKGDGARNFTKTIYDPAVWSDVKLEQSLKEAIQDVSNKGKLFIESPTIGTTKEGYKIVFTTDTGKVTSFWFD